MIKYVLLFILKRIIKILNLNKRFLVKFTPFKFIYFKILAVFLFIRTLFKTLQGYTIFRYLNMVLRFLSFSSLFINFILFILLMELNIVNWTPKNFSSYLNNINYLPLSFKEWLLDKWAKIYYYFSLLWNYFLEYLSYLLNKILYLIEKLK